MPLPRQGAAFREEPDDFREEPEKQRDRSCRAQELSRSRAQGKERQKKQLYRNYLRADVASRDGRRHLGDESSSLPRTALAGR